MKIEQAEKLKLPINGGIYGQDHLAEHNFINGDFVKYPFSVVIENINPSIGKSICKYPQTTQPEITRAIDSAREAFKSWKRLSRVKRAEYFNKVAQLIDDRREDIATVISLETGKNYNESIAEVNEALHMAQYAFGSGRIPHGEVIASEISEKDSYMLRKPKGVIAIVSPFNFPVAIGAFWCAAPALVEGNTVVLKPSEDAPMSSQICAELYYEAGFPPGVFNVIHGDGKVGDALVHGDVDHICFTGSAEVGQHIRKVAAESWHKTTSCEMGSKSACIIFDDVEYELSVPAAVASAFKLSGQRCVSSGRMIVQRNILNGFIAKFIEKASQLKKNQVESLHKNILSILNESLKFHGTTIMNFKFDNMKTGDYKEQLNVYGRVNKACNRCNFNIIKIKSAGRGTYLCKNCQK